MLRHLNKAGTNTTKPMGDIKLGAGWNCPQRRTLGHVPYRSWTVSGLEPPEVSAANTPAPRQSTGRREWEGLDGIRLMSSESKQDRQGRAPLTGLIHFRAICKFREHSTLERLPKQLSLKAGA